MTSKTRLITLAVVAVMLPTSVLSVIQYRSLAELEDKTKVAVEENLRKTAQGLSGNVEKRFRDLAKEALLPLAPRDLNSKNEVTLARHIGTMLEQHPAISQLFFVSNCTCVGDSLALFSKKGSGLQRIVPPQFKQQHDLHLAVNLYEAARMAYPSDFIARDLIFWHSYCPNCDRRTWPSPDKIYIFKPLTEPAYDKPYGFAGILLDSNYLQSEFFAMLAAELTQAAPRTDGSKNDLVIGVFDEEQRAIYMSHLGANNYEMRGSLAPVFPRWQLALGYKDTTITALARNNFRQSLLLSVFVLLCLLVGIALILRATTRELQFAQAKSDFVSNVSHELKTPLTMIRLFAEILSLGRVKSPEKARDYYRIIENESRRLSQLIDNILDFSKMEAGRRSYQTIESDVAELVERVIKSYEYQMITSGFELQVDIQDSLPTIMIDPDAISQAVLNLLDNAVKYSDKIKTVGVRVFQSGQYVAVEVSDSGIGIPRSEHQKIFEKFHRVGTGLVHNTKGSGLGLSLVKHIIEAHRGQVRVESGTGEGSRFTLLLPLSVVADAPGKADADAGGYEVAESLNH